MNQFNGFSSSNAPRILLPGSFFTELLPAIETVEELKVLLFIFWRVNMQEGPFPFVRKSDLTDDPEMAGGLGDRLGSVEATLDWALEQGVERGTLLAIEASFPAGKELIYLINSPRGQAAVAAVENGEWDPAAATRGAEPPTPRPPNIFKIYEENIGPLTPMIAEALKEAEAYYPLSWIEEAIRIAVENNVRRWRYAEAILQNWHEKGKDERRVRGDSEKDRRRYVRGEFSDFVEH